MRYHIEKILEDSKRELQQGKGTDMVVGIYINNEGIKTIACQGLEKGNPGIGGTEYCILLLAEAYKKYYPDEQVILFCNASSILPSVDKKVLVANVLELPAAAKKEHVDFLVMTYGSIPSPHKKELFSKLEEQGVQTVIWGHNYYFANDCDLLAQSKCVVANVFVGKQQYDRYIDHELIHKSTYVYNMYPEVGENCSKARKKNTVTYIGSLIPPKGFHILAKQWKKILKKVPDAELNVIGSGKLYSREESLGKFKIAEKAYEDSFMPFLTGKDGEILPSVHFLGLLGDEKKAVIQETKVGVANPSGRTETFGISALDFESYGIPVVTIGKGGFLDTIIHKKSGLLYRQKKNLSKYVIRLLKDDEENEKLGSNAYSFAKEFTIEKGIKRWHDIFLSLSNKADFDFIPPSNFLGKELKWLRLANYRFKKALKIKGGLSLIGIETLGWNLLRKLKH